MRLEQFQQENDYHAALSIAGQLLQRSLITRTEYNRLKEELVKKHHPVIGSLGYVAKGVPPQK